MEVKVGYKQTVIGQIPEDWVAISLSEFCTLQRGFDITEATRVPGTIPVYSSSGLSYYHNKAMVSPPGVVTGRKGILGKVFLINEPFWPHDTTLWVKDFKGNHPAYVALVLKNFHLERLDAATAVPTLNRNNLAGYVVAVPPSIAEQEAIARALSDVDALIEALEQLIAKKRQVKLGAMQELLTGKRRLRGFRGEWKPITLIDLLTQSATYGIVKAGEFQVAGVPMVRGGDIKDSKILRDLPYVTEEKSNEFARTILKANDVVIALVGYPGEAAKVPSDLAGANISRAVGLLRLNSKINPDYLVCYLNSSQGRSMVLAPSAGSAQLVVNLSELNKLQFNLPPLSEQTAIAEILSDMDAEIAALEAKLAKARQVKQGMMQELLTGRIRLL